MKRNTFLAVLACCAISFGAQAASLTTTIQSGGYSNLLGLLYGRPAVITAVTVTSQATNSARLRIYDSPTNTVWFTNAAYVTEGLYATNYIQTYVNYYGATNSITNVALVHYSVTNAAAGYLYPLRFDAIAPTNSSAIYDGVNYSFINGVWGTNASVGAATVTVTYQ
jgi:hypothetical protein